MYLSKLIFTPNAQGEDIGRFNIGDVYSYHQWLWRCFDGVENQQLNQADFIFRIDTFSNILIIYVQSSRMPKQKIQGWKIETKLCDLTFKQGDMAQFSLRANPVVSKSINGKQRRHDVLMHAKYLAKRDNNTDQYELMQQAGIAWLVKRQEWLGVEFLASTLEFTNYNQQSLHKNRIKFSSVDYQGVLKINEPHLFASSVMRGIGKAKAFGCGLMLIRRI